MPSLKALSVLAAAAGWAQALDLSDLTGEESASATGKASGSAGISIQDWQCQASPYTPVEVCDVEGNPLSYGSNTESAFTCSQQHAYAKNTTLAYGFATVVSGAVDAQIVGACYQLTYDVAGNVNGTVEASTKTLVVQATNVTSGIGEALFQLAIPGAGAGLFSQSACVEQYNATPAGYGRASTKSDCDTLPTILQAACRFRFDWISNALPTKRDIAGLSSAVSGALATKVDYTRVMCPSELVAKSKYVLPDDDQYPPPPTYPDVTADAPASAPAPTTTDAPVEVPGPVTPSAPIENSVPVDAAQSSDYDKRDGTPQPVFAQCGGKGYAGPTNCDSGLSCKVQSQYYSQCMLNVQTLYGQCGGQGFNGPTQCDKGLVCEIIHAAYSQCQPSLSTRSVSPVEARGSTLPDDESTTEEPTPSATVKSDSTHGEGVEDDASKGKRPTVLDGVSGNFANGAAGLAAPSAMIGLAVLAMLFL